ncbi:serine hydrolase domain-containing protein [Geobacter argillaceus]|uniref:CubicO group peptidase (Beta-lactamase class C family) n=1 Tax=Geobacter argillaceus TaxID=345631 RepID=A0A562WQR8_9BACT|nr:serine hydrolase domain-containing protein [Geobacter argillaceus]TWJ32693.1 CubicO group peptidase (beta-lactamase class C family) [Geobacter argillaceus]
MRWLYVMILVVTTFLFNGLAAAGNGPQAVMPASERIDQLMAGAMGKGLIAGGVVLIGNQDRILFEKPYGRVSSDPHSPPVTNDTLFDLASLTKVVATTPAIMKLAEERKLSLVDPLSRWFPEFVGKGKDEVLVVNLLTHTSGLDDFGLSSLAPMQSAVEGAAEQRLKGEVGSRFHYADINFILLAELVRRVSGEPLDVYTRRQLYGQLGMNDTMFAPGAVLHSRIAASPSDRSHLAGQPQDSLARLLGGVAGHAGLFSTAGDLARFCRMVFDEGVLDGIRVLEERTVRQMTAPYFSRKGQVVRGLGWDIASPFSSPRGNGFSRSSFGHTGYSGTSLWLDPSAGIYVILLTSRLEYNKTHEFSQLRGSLSSLAAELYGVPPALRDLEELAGE